MKTLTTLTISPQGQITVPKQWREALSLKPGKRVLAWMKEGAKTKVLTLTPEPANWTAYMAGLGQEVWTGVDIEDYINKEREAWEKNEIK
jgi:AbrB family looped-hinge helix DNA binding protein